MVQDYNHYTDDDQMVWRSLFERQQNFIPGKVSVHYLNCLEEMSPVLNSNSIPRFNQLNDQLMNKTGWSIQVVPGLIPVDEFFVLMNQKKFVSSTWLRSVNQLDYLEEPDMFHDVFGHVPLLMDKTFTDFIQKYTDLALKFLDNRQILAGLERVYWFTIEFGLINENNKRNKIYGAGIISSYGETNHVANDDIEIREFDIVKIFQTPFSPSAIQNFYYSVNDFQTLYESVEELEDYVKRVASGQEKFVEGYTSLDLK